LPESDAARLLDRLYAALDEHRFEDLRALFTPDARATTPGGTAEGVDALLAQAKRSHECLSELQHLITGTLVDTDGEAATLRANVVTIFADSTHSPTYELGEVWRGHAVRDTTGWSISDFTMTPVRQRGIRPTPSPSLSTSGFTRFKAGSPRNEGGATGS
jgi:hypothetical protein